MEYVIQGRSPRKLYDFFEQISAIPRGSRNPEVQTKVNKNKHASLAVKYSFAIAKA